MPSKTYMVAMFGGIGGRAGRAGGVDMAKIREQLGRIKADVLRLTYVTESTFALSSK